MGQAAQLPPLKAWLGLAATLTLCAAESEDQARGPHALLLIRSWRGNRDASWGPGSAAEGSWTRRPGLSSQEMEGQMEATGPA